MKVATPEPLPTPGVKVVYRELVSNLEKSLHKDPVLDIVREYIMARVRFGQEKYGCYLETNNGRDAINDALQESIDLCMYLYQKILEEGSNEVWELKLLYLRALFFLADLVRYSLKQ